MVGRVVAPPATIGMLGGGQLGRYALVAARRMGYRTVVLEPDARAPAGAVADEHLVAAYDDEDALDRLAEVCAVVTTEFENPPAVSLERLERSTAVAPSAVAVAIAQDRRTEKRFLAAGGFPVAPWGLVESLDDRPDVGFPAILKTAQLGYDGKGQTAIASIDRLGDAWTELGGGACVLERALALDSEVSVVVARTADGRTATYEVSENHHVNGVLDLTVVPARVAAAGCRTGDRARADRRRCSRLRRRARRRAVRRRRRVVRQRTGAAPTQQRALDPRRRPHQPVRAAGQGGVQDRVSGRRR